MNKIKLLVFAAVAAIILTAAALASSPDYTSLKAWVNVVVIAYFLLIIFEQPLEKVANNIGVHLAYIWLALHTGAMFAWLSLRGDYQSKLAIFAAGLAIRDKKPKGLTLAAVDKAGKRTFIVPEQAAPDEPRPHATWQRPARPYKNNRTSKSRRLS